jgi:hypothetical protein
MPPRPTVSGQLERLRHDEPQTLELTAEGQGGCIT